MYVAKITLNTVTELTNTDELHVYLASSISTLREHVPFVIKTVLTHE